MKYFSFILMTVLIFLQCTPKKSDKMAQTEGEKNPAEMTEGQDNFRANPPEPGPAPEIGLGDYEHFTLDNGLEVVVVQNHKLPRVSFRLLVDHDPVLEGPKAGLASATADLMSKGTENRTKDEINEAVDFIGASFSTFTKGMYGTCLTEHEDQLLEIMSDVLINPSFPDEELDKWIKRRKSSLKASETDPRTIAGNVSKVLRYGKDHPYGDITTKETLDSITIEDCKEHYRNYFKPNISYLAIVGDVSLDEARNMAEENFGSWDAGPVKENEHEQPERPNVRKVCFVDVPGSVQSVINITYPVELQPSNPQKVHAEVMNNVLGGGVFSGYLMQNLREDKAYTYGARSSLNDDEHVGYFTANASVRNEVTDSAIVQFIHEMNRIRTDTVDEEHLELVKNAKTGSFARSLESSQRVATLAMNIRRYDLPKDYYDKNLKRLEQTTQEDVMKMARKYIHPNQSYLLVVGNKDAVADKLLQFAGDDQIHYYDQYGNPVEQSKVAIPEGMTGEDVLDQYLEAIGGEKKLRSIENAKLELSMNMMGQKISITQLISPPEQYKQEMVMGGQVMQMQVYNRGEGYMMARGQRQPLNDAQKQSLSLESKIFKEMYFPEEGYEVELKGVEKFEDSDVYKVNLRSPEGKTTSQYYDIETGLKVREVSSQEGPGGQTMTIETRYGDYKEVNGVLTPFEMTISGGNMPMPMEMSIENVEYNTDLPTDAFTTE